MDYKDLIFSANKRLKDFYELKEAGLLCKHDDFVPAVHYPAITDYPEIEYNEMFKGYTPPENGLMDVYVHFPFCAQKCVFCHYPSRYGVPDSEKDEYISALEKEIDIYMKLLNFDKIKLRTALIGGGTPTDLTPKQLDRFLKIFANRCDLSNLQQFNYDVSPFSLIGPDGIERLKIMRSYGVDRLTIGIQSMNDNILSKMNRAHSKKEAFESIENTIKHGFKLNVEFIYGYPGQTPESWFEELKELVKIDADEFQFYRLKVNAYGDQQGTIKTYKLNNISEFPSIEDTMVMKQMNIDYLTSLGFFEHLRRVFTKKKSNISLYAYDQCCLLYDQMSFGITAFSSLRDRFVLNTPNFREYYQRISEGKLPYNRGYIRNADAQQRWAIILPLKNYFIRKNFYKQFTGIDIKDTKHYKTIELLKKYGLVEEDSYKIKLTEKGSFFADEVCEVFYDIDFIPFAKEYYNEGELNPYTVNKKAELLVRGIK